MNTVSDKNSGKKFFLSHMRGRRLRCFDELFARYGENLGTELWILFQRHSIFADIIGFYERMAIAESQPQECRCIGYNTAWGLTMPYNPQIQGRREYVGTEDFAKFMKSWHELSEVDKGYNLRCPNSVENGEFCISCNTGSMGVVGDWRTVYNMLKNQ